MCRIVIIKIFVFLLVSVAAASPEQISFFRIPPVIKETESEIAYLQRELDQLPYISEPLQLEAYGFHGGYLPVSEEMPDEPRWVLDVVFDDYVRLEQIILVPCADKRFNSAESFGFPRRFRITMFSADGEEITVAEWLGEDCPDPGRMPLVLDVPVVRSHRYRIEVFQGDVQGEQECFALDEFFGILKHSIYSPIKVRTSSEYASLPYWSKTFLYDQKTSMGLPLGTEKVGRQEDYEVIFEHLPENFGIELGLEQEIKVGWISFYPAHPPSGISIPGYGFPKKMSIAVVPEGKSLEDLGNWNWIVLNWEEGSPGNNVLRLKGEGRVGDRILIRLKDLPVYNGKPTLALGEIVVHQEGQRLPVKSIVLDGFPDGAAENAHMLMDGLAGGRPVLFLEEWIQQIEQRNQLTHKLSEAVCRLEKLGVRWNTFWVRFGVSALVLFSVFGITAAAIARMQRYRHAKALRRQISSDLHDDLGSKLATISLTSEFVAMNAQNPDVLEGCRSILGTAKEMHNALRDVLWVTDSQTDSLGQLVLQLGQIAEKTIGPDMLSLCVPEPQVIPRKMINIRTKRDIILFFRETLHNAMEHAEATLIRVDIQVRKKRFILVVEDDGVGFDMTGPGDREELCRRKHYGLSSMEERAKRLHARYRLVSHPGEGTEISLDVPL